MNKDLQVIESKKNLAEAIADFNADEQLLILCSQDDTAEKTINSMVYANANIKSKDEMKAVYANVGDSFDFDSMEFDFVFDTVSFLKHSPFTLTGL